MSKALAVPLLVSLLLLAAFSDTLSRASILDIFSPRRLPQLASGLSFPKALGFGTALAVLAVSIAAKSSTFHRIAARIFRMATDYSPMAPRKWNRALRSRPTRESRLANKNGGEVGGLANEGNTCFMNSVLSSLASSTALLRFFNDHVYEDTTVHASGKVTKVRTGSVKSAMRFTAALKELLDSLNGKYGSRGREFSTSALMKKMPDGPKQNFFSGYNQEDAQEFYQSVMRIVEKEYNAVYSTKAAEGEKKKFIPQQPDFVSGCDQLGKLGTVYVPAHQIDANISDSANLVAPLELVTPVDGVSAERIGCMACGEIGGIRYAVNSGLGLNLPYDRSYRTQYELTSLLDEWKKPEFIDDVNCNRCGLVQTREFLEESIRKADSEKLLSHFAARVAEIGRELEKNHISDEVFEKLTTKQMIRKTRKSKQIFLSRPPPLLCIHINRSVIDPHTFSIVKNSKNLSFPSVLDLAPYVAEPKDINMDARRPFRVQDENEEEEKGTAKRYNLRAVISHMGTHNYGHYICYRRWRGTWWKVNDEAVYVTTEHEVLNSPGTFMLFYEYDTGTEDAYEPLSDDDLEKEAVEEKLEADSSSESESEESDREPEKAATTEFPNATFEVSKFEMGEERAYV